MREADYRWSLVLQCCRALEVVLVDVVNWRLTTAELELLVSEAEFAWPDFDRRLSSLWE